MTKRKRAKVGPPIHERVPADLKDRDGWRIRQGARVTGWTATGRRIGGEVLGTYLDHAGRPVVEVRQYRSHHIRSFRPGDVRVQRGKSKAQRLHEIGL